MKQALQVPCFSALSELEPHRSFIASKIHTSRRPTITALGVALACALVLLPGSLNAQEDAESLPFEAEMGPVTGQLGRMGQIQVPSGVGFVDQANMDGFNQVTGNLPNPADVGALFSQEAGWIVFFNFEDIGFVKDDTEELDADALLASLKKTDEPANEMRRSQGLDELHTDGWSRPPFYDEKTNNLTWGLRLRAGDGSKVINHQVRLLGRRGVMNVIIVDSPDAIEASIQQIEPILASFEYSEGNRYADFKSGDRVAEIGLAALVAGGGLALAAKSGFLSKFIKPIILFFVVGFGAFGRKIKSFFSRGPAQQTYTE